MTPDQRQSLEMPPASSDSPKVSVDPGSPDQETLIDKEILEASFLVEESTSSPAQADANHESAPVNQALDPSTVSDSVAEPDAVVEATIVKTAGAPSAFGRLWPWALLLLAGGGVGWFVYTKIIAPAGFQGPPQFGPMAVTVSPPTTRTVQDKADYIATLESRESVMVRPEATGRVNQIFVSSGDRVEAGTPLLKLNAQRQRAQVAGRRAEVDAARADIVAAQASVESARRQLTALQSTLQSRQSDLRFRQQEYDRFKSLQEKGAASLQVLQERQSELDQARADVSEMRAQMSTQEAVIAQAQADVLRRQQERDAAIATANQDQLALRDFTVTAPIDGTVSSLPAKVGDLVNESTTLLSLTQNQSLEIKIEVPQEEASRLEPGMAVQLLDQDSKILNTGKVVFISPDVSAATQSIQVKALFDNSSGQLRNNQMIRARIIWASRSGVLVPTTAISRLAGRNFVFVAQPAAAANCPQGEAPSGAAGANQWVAVQQPVELGPIIDNRQDVTSGLSLSDRVITSGLLQLQNCTPIQPNP
ncbi:MAG: efflux RND transporter periplasmic adaptor subunit [Cyanobacteria bacterium P01_F01_bin.42]